MVNTKMNTPKLTVAMERNIRSKLQYIPSKVNSMNVKKFGDTLVVDSGMPSDTFNIAYGGSIDIKIANDIRTHFANKKLPMAWWVGPEAQAKYDVKSVMKKSGFVHDEYDVGMICDLGTLELPVFETPKGFTIVQCSEQYHYTDFGIVLSSIFDPVDQHVQHFYQMLATIQNASRRDLILFVGYDNGEPVSTAVVFMTDVAGIFDISTMPNKQKRGYGSAMFYTALKYAKATDCQHAVLQASPDGLNIYKRFGFKTICGFDVYSNRQHLE